jgi:hypothetical protein
MGLENNWTTFEISRPLVHGIETFLPIVRAACQEYIGDDLRHAAPGVIPNDENSEWQERRLYGVPLYSVYKKHMLPVVQLIARSNPRNASEFHKLAIRMMEQRKGKLSRSQEALQAIPGQLEDVMLRFGDVSPDRVVAGCGGIAIGGSLRNDNYELVLTIDDGARFVEEHAVYVRAFDAIPHFSSHTNLNGLYSARVAVASISNQTSVMQRKGLLHALRREKPETLELEFGAIQPPFVR